MWTGKVIKKLGVGYTDSEIKTAVSTPVSGNDNAGAFLITGTYIDVDGKTKDYSVVIPSEEVLTILVEDYLTDGFGVNYTHEKILGYFICQMEGTSDGSEIFVKS